MTPLQKRRDEIEKKFYCKTCGKYLGSNYGCNMCYCDEKCRGEYKEIKGEENARTNR